MNKNFVACIKKPVWVYFISFLFAIKSRLFAALISNNDDKFKSNIGTNKDLAVGVPAGISIAAMTLSEVLIALAVVGVISSIVIPSLMNDSNDQEFKAAFKKKYAEIAGVTERVKQDYGGTFSIPVSPWTLRTAFSKYMTFKTLCNWHEGVGGRCWSNTINTIGSNKEISALSSTFGATANDNFYSGAILNDGTFIYFFYSYVENTAKTSWTWINSILMDVNGKNKPNQLGRDIYWISISNDSVFPFKTQIFPYIPDTVWINGSHDFSSPPEVCDSKKPTSIGLACGINVLNGIDY